MSAVEFGTLPAPPSGRLPAIRTSWRYLVGAHTSVAGLFDSLSVVRQKAIDDGRAPQGRLSADQLDILRAAIVFTSSGLDACMSRLVHDALPALLASRVEVEGRFVEFLKRELKKPEASSGFTKAVVDRDARGALVDLYIDQLTRASFQGSGDLQKRVKGSLCIPNALLPDERFADLDPFFESRNAIVHWMDYVDRTGASKARTPRSLPATLEDCNRVFALCADVIVAVAARLR